MYSFCSILFDSITASVFLFPILFFYQKRIHKGHALLPETFFLMLFVFYLSAVLSVVGIPTLFYYRPDFTVNLLPLADSLEHPICYLRNTFLNILLFLPLGFFLPLLWECFRKRNVTLLFGFCFSLYIELAQLFTFRLTDIDDLITNTFGTLLGYFLYKKLFEKWQQHLNYFYFQITNRTDPTFPLHCYKRTLPFIMITVIGIMISFQPLLTEFLWNIFFDFL